MLSAIELLSLIFLGSIISSKEGFAFAGSLFPYFKYNNLTQILCNFTTTPRIVNGIERRCCGDRFLYLHPSQICCGEQVRNVSDLLNDKYECCGSEFIRTNGQEFCCDGRRYKPWEFKKRTDTKCCGRKPYNSNDSLCCNGMVRSRQNNTNIDCCGSETYDTKEHDCDGVNIIEHVPEHFQRCAGTAYDTRIKVCCNGHMVNKPIGYSATKTPNCCGNILIMDEYKETCSRNHVVPIGHMWCGSESVNFTTGRCCDGVAYHKVKASSKCCGKRLINIAKKEFCCNEKLEIAYDPHNQRCCGGKVIEFDDHCCNGELYNNRSSICCNGRFGGEFVILKTNYEQNQCCSNKPYDEFTEECYGGIIRKKPNSKDLYCGSVLFKDAKDKKLQCCFQKTYNPINQSCCGKEIYNIKRQTCIGGKVIRKDKKQSKSKDLVCAGKLFKDAKIKNMRCCFKSIYNPRRQSCCGKHVYNLKKQKCFGGKVINNTKESINGNTRLDPDKQSCVDKKVKNKRNLSTRVECDPSVSWTNLHQVKFNCINVKVLIMKKLKRRARKPVYMVKRILVGRNIKTFEKWRLSHCNEKITKANSFILVTDNIKTPLRNVSFIRNKKRTRNFIINKCRLE